MPRLNFPRPHLPITLPVLLLLAMACGGPAFRFQEDFAINEALESHRPLPGYTYYYSGPEDYPLAILGIRPEIRLKRGFWIPVELNEKKLARWMHVIDNPHRSLRSRYSGKVIRSAEGKELGIWYSPQEWPTARWEADGALSIATPPNTLHRKITRDAGGFP